MKSADPVSTDLASADAGWSTAEHRFDAGHPTAAGHFPGNAIIPGALLLDHVLSTFVAAAPLEVQVAKFLAPVRPGDKVAIRWRRQDTGAVAFECRVGETLALSGAVKAAA